MVTSARAKEAGGGLTATLTLLKVSRVAASLNCIV